MNNLSQSAILKDKLEKAASKVLSKIDHTVSKLIDEQVPSLENPVVYKVTHRGGALVREGYDTNTNQIHQLAYGQQITVVELKGRRARMISPVYGWVSTRTKEGTSILKQVNFTTGVSIRDSNASVSGGGSSFGGANHLLNSSGGGSHTSLQKGFQRAFDEKFNAIKQRESQEEYQRRKRIEDFEENLQQNGQQSSASNAGISISGNMDNSMDLLGGSDVQPGPAQASVMSNSDDLLGGDTNGGFTDFNNSDFADFGNGSAGSAAKGTQSQSQNKITINSTTKPSISTTLKPGFGAAIPKLSAPSNNPVIINLPPPPGSSGPSGVPNSESSGQSNKVSLMSQNSSVGFGEYPPSKSHLGSQQLNFQDSSDMNHLKFGNVNDLLGGPVGGTNNVEISSNDSGITTHFPTAAVPTSSGTTTGDLDLLGDPGPVTSSGAGTANFFADFQAPPPSTIVPQKQASPVDDLLGFGDTNNDFADFGSAPAAPPPAAAFDLLGGGNSPVNNNMGNGTSGFGGLGGGGADLLGLDLGSTQTAPQSQKQESNQVVYLTDRNKELVAKSESEKKKVDIDLDLFG